MINAKDAAWLSWWIRRLRTQKVNSFCSVMSAWKIPPLNSHCLWCELCRIWYQAPCCCKSDYHGSPQTGFLSEICSQQPRVWESHILISVAFNIDFKRQWPNAAQRTFPNIPTPVSSCSLSKYVWLGQTETLNTGFVFDVALHKIKLFQTFKHTSGL